MGVIVGVGYAGGGLEPLRKLVRTLPAGRGLAVVVVTHALPVAPPEAGPALETDASSLRVIAAEDGLPLQSDCIYVVPPEHLLSLSDGKFVMEQFVVCEGMRLPIDHFLCSLAAQQGPAAGVLLSGEGPDGTLGLSEIKAAGGRTIVQDPAEAAQREMPQGAADAGVVDLVLPVGRIAAELLAWAEQLAAQDSVEDDRSALRSILALLRSRTGHDFHCYKPNTLLRRTRRRMELAKADMLWEYFRHLQGHPVEVHRLRADLLIGVTDFFRQVEAWRYLEERVLPQLIAAAAPGRTVRAWVAGCATGKEAYTLAMLLLEAVAASGKKIPIQVFATDADEAALEVARLGLYQEAEIRSVPPARLRRFFERRGQSYRVTKKLRETIVFAQQNITSDPPFAKLDLVSCRNLLIYLDAEAQKKAIAIFHFALGAGGYLFLGSSESIAGYDDLFAPLSKKWRIFRCLAVPPARRPRLPAAVLTEGPAARAGGPGIAHGGSLALLAQQMLLERFAPAAVIADRRRRLLYNIGPIDRYLTVAPGESSLDVVEMARAGLRTALRGAFAKAAIESRLIHVVARVRRAGLSMPVQISVAPLRGEKAAESLLLITFEDRPPAVPLLVAESTGAAGSRQLEEELRFVRAELQCTVEQLEASNEELKASNEEALAGNEELQAANEELETSGEELQSLNDELNAVNISLQERNDELKSAEAESARLASFPEQNPNPVVETDPAGHVSYQNPAARALFPDLPARGLAHPWLADLPAAAKNLVRTGATQVLREVAVAGATYEQALFHVAETGRIRIYGRDVTERKRGEDLMHSRLRLLSAAQNDEQSVADTLQMALDEIEALTGSAIGFYHFMEADQETLSLQSWSTNTLRKMCTAEGRGRHYPVSQAGVWVECIRERRAVIHNDYASLPQRKGLPQGHAPIVRELVVPVLRGDRIVAIIGVGNKPTDYTAADGEIVAYLGDFSWEIVERRRFAEEIKRSAAVLNAINSIFRMALGCESEEELGRACLATAEELTRSKFGFIGEIGADGLLHDTAISDPGWALCTLHDQAGHRRQPGNFQLHGIYGRVLLDGKSFFTNDPGSHPDSIGTPGGHPPLKSFLGVPLRRDGKVIGVIAMGNREGGYRQDELKSLEALAPAVAEALHRVRTERALTRSEERLSRAQAIAHLGSWELDLTDNLLTWSDEVYRIFGLEPQEFDATYEAFLEHIHPEDRAAVDAAYSDSIHEGRDTYEIEHRVVRRSTGEIRIVHEKCEHFRDGSGRIIRSVGMVHDITERKRAEEAQQESLRRFELLAHAAGELLQAREPQKIVEALCRRVMVYLGCHVFFNFLADEAAGKLRLNAYSGISEEEAHCIRWLDYGVGICGCAARDGCRIVAEHIPTTSDARTELVKSRGIKAYACQPLLAPEGKVLGTLSFGTCDREVFSADDLSLMQAVTDLVAVAVARMQEAERLRRTVDELARSNKDLEQYAYVSSHDLQEPLRAVSGFMTLLESRYRDALDERAQTYIAHAVEGAKRMTQLIDGLLEYARLDSRCGRISRCATREALDEVLAGLRPRLEEIGARVTVADLPVLAVDRTQLAQLFQNLLGNAVKFRREGTPSEIHVGARIEGGEWVLSVRDNGIGISEQQFDRIFLIFQRLHTRGKYPGTGIGLAICKRIVERHGGRIWVESEVGVGSSFFFTMPGEGAASA